MLQMRELGEGVNGSISYEVEVDRGRHRSGEPVIEDTVKTSGCCWDSEILRFSHPTRLKSGRLGVYFIVWCLRKKQQSKSSN